MLTFEELVTRVVLMARDTSPRETVELGVLHGLCLDVAGDLAPDLLDTMNSVESLESLVLALESLPDLILPVTNDKSRWSFVRN